MDIKEVIPKQQASMDSIQKYLHNDEFSIYDIIIRANGIHAPTIKTNTWNAIANSKIELVAYEKLSALADIEERKENLRWRLEKLMDFISQNIEKTDMVKKKILVMTILDMVGAEKDLQSQIEEILKNKTVRNSD